MILRSFWVTRHDPIRALLPAMAIDLEIVRAAIHHMHPLRARRRPSDPIDHLPHSSDSRFPRQTLGRVFLFRRRFPIPDSSGRPSRRFLRPRPQPSRPNAARNPARRRCPSGPNRKSRGECRTRLPWCRRAADSGQALAAEFAPNADRRSSRTSRPYSRTNDRRLSSRPCSSVCSGRLPAGWRSTSSASRTKRAVRRLSCKSHWPNCSSAHTFVSIVKVTVHTSMQKVPRRSWAVPAPDAYLTGPHSQSLTFIRA